MPNSTSQRKSPPTFLELPSELRQQILIQAYVPVVSPLTSLIPVQCPVYIGGDIPTKRMVKALQHHWRLKQLELGLQISQLNKIFPYLKDDLEYIEKKWRGTLRESLNEQLGQHGLTYDGMKMWMRGYFG
ncbi:hypothetical protein E2P81_ATG03504 [Venturia nashicola]|uniref:Uncharacterized protein n=1 Tax=Venturia nashicola TaxID=86259 RepID=A0A4Z1PAP5_9PEZI|nr:hypothetical protein E6O75_ATG03578 [Venturia nashicola]TLD37829.1 hypothetical protein E2P81_ATG03504 [Venturia nashicola]